MLRDFEIHILFMIVRMDVVKYTSKCLSVGFLNFYCKDVSRDVLIALL